MPPAWQPGPRIDVGSVLGRTFDTFGREWSLFLVLALPAGVGGLLQVLASPASLSGIGGSQATTVDGARVLQDAAVLLLAVVIAGVLSGFAGLSAMIATDRLWRGQPTGVGDAVSGALRVLPRVLGLWLLLAVAAVGVAAVVAVVGVILYAVASAAGVLVLVILLILLGVTLLIVEVRLSLVLPVLLFEQTGILESLSRTWARTRGHAIMLFVTLLVIGLTSGFAIWGTSLINSAVDNRLVAGLAEGLGTAIASPLGSIWVVLAWGDLSGPRHADSGLMARGRGRMTAVAIVVGFGGLLLVAGSVAFAGAMARATIS